MIHDIISETDSSSIDERWWRADDGSAHDAIFAVAKRIWDDDSVRRQGIVHFMRLYGAREALDIHSSEFIATTLPSRRLRYNAVQAVCETAVSRLGKNRPKAAFLTQGGDWDLLKKSRRLSKYVEGNFYEAKVYEKGQRAFRDATVIGTGVLHFFPEKRSNGKSWRVGCERVCPWHILVDHDDGMDGEPRQMFRVHHVDREVLYEKFAKDDRWKSNKKALRDMLAEAEENHIEILENGNRVNRVEVIEAWHLPSGPGAGDGRHSISVSSGVLRSREWENDWFPFSFYHWQPPIKTFWGSGIAAMINGIQVNINRLLRVLEKSYHLCANPWIAARRGSGVAPGKMTNEIGKIFYYEGDHPPIFQAHAPVHQQFFQHLQQLKQDAFDLPGVSQLAATGRKPADLESGEALRQYNAIEDARHAAPALNYERFYMESAKIVVSLSRWMNANGMPTEVQAQYRRRWRSWVEPIEWSEVDIDADSVALQVFPTSLLPSIPSGRTATIQQWLAAGFIDQQTAMYLLDVPDLEAFPSPNVVMIEAILDDIEHMLDEQEPRLPEPFQDLQLTQRLATSSYLRARTDGAPEESLELLRQYMVAVDRFIEVEESAQMQAAQMAPQQTPAQPSLPEVPGTMGLPQMQAAGVMGA